MEEFVNTKQCRAKKTYVCHICGKPILCGREYIYEAQRAGGCFTENRRHIHCDAMLDAYLNKWEEDHYTEQWMTEEIFEKVCGRICTEGQQEECDAYGLYACEKCQRVMLSPSIMGAVRKSVQENRGANND